MRRVKAYVTDNARASLGERLATLELKTVQTLVFRGGSGEELAMHESVTALKVSRDEGAL